MKTASMCARGGGTGDDDEEVVVIKYCPFVVVVFSIAASVRVTRGRGVMPNRKTARGSRRGVLAAKSSASSRVREGFDGSPAVDWRFFFIFVPRIRNSRILLRIEN